VKRWYSHRYHTTLAHRIVFATIPLLPRFFHPPIAAVTAGIFFLLLRRERRAVAANLRRVVHLEGPRLWWNVGRVFYSFCDLIVSYCYVPHASFEDLLGMLRGGGGGLRKIDECLAAGTGVIVWTAHLGNWEFASRLLEMHGRTVHIARLVEDNPAEIMLRNLMVNDRLRIVDLGRGTAASLELVHALRRNEIVAIQGDRVYQRRTASLPFFGAPAPFPLGPFLLSQASGAPVLPGFVLRQGWLRYRVAMGDPIWPADGGTAAQEAGLRQAVGFLETTLQTDYDQWLNFYPFWPEAPHG
jgi:Kdo2-lipid IVA lauroyltransferase/acyltransferase